MTNVSLELLPNEMLLEIFNFFSPRDIGRLSIVNKFFNNWIANNENLLKDVKANLLTDFQLASYKLKQFMERKLIEANSKNEIGPILQLYDSMLRIESNISEGVYHATTKGPFKGHFHAFINSNYVLSIPHAIGAHGTCYPIDTKIISSLSGNTTAEIKIPSWDF